MKTRYKHTNNHVSKSLYIYLWIQYTKTYMIILSFCGHVVDKCFFIYLDRLIYKHILHLPQMMYKNTCVDHKRCSNREITFLANFKIIGLFLSRISPSPNTPLLHLWFCSHLHHFNCKSFNYWSFCLHPDQCKVPGNHVKVCLLQNVTYIS